MQPIIMDSDGMRRTLVRLSHEIEERDEGFENVVLVGVKRGGSGGLQSSSFSYLLTAAGGRCPCAPTMWARTCPHPKKNISKCISRNSVTAKIRFRS